MPDASDHLDELDDISSASVETFSLPFRSAREQPAANKCPQPDFGTMHWLVRQLGSRWTFAILEALRCEPVRFAKLKRSLGSISQRMLTLSLRKLERDGLVHREEIGGQPPQVSYELTPLGASLLTQLAVLDCWLEANRQKIAKANASYYGRRHNRD